MKRMHISILTALMILALAVPALAQPGGGPGNGSAGFLNCLPPEKQQAITTILDQQRAGRFELRQQMRAKMIQLQGLVVDPKAEPAKMDALIDEIGAMRNKMFKDRIETQRKIFLETGVVMPGGNGGRGGKGGRCGNGGRGPNGGRGGKGGPA